MSENASITTGLPSGSDVAETLGERGVLTRSGSRAGDIGISQTSNRRFCSAHTSWPEFRLPSRQIPMLLRDSGLEVLAFLPELHAEAGEGAFFSNLAESYVPMAIKAGTVSSDVADRWLSDQRDASSRGTFFGACNYYTYIARKPG